MKTESTSYKFKHHSIKRRIVSTFVAVIAGFIALAAAGGYVYLKAYEHSVTDQMCESAAESCASVVEAMALNDDGKISSQDIEYEKWRTILRDLCINTDMDYMYALQYYPETGTTTYIMCVAADEAADEKVQRELGYGTTIKSELSDQMRRALKGEKVTDAMILDNQYGTELSWFRKVDGWDNVIVGVDYSTSAQRHRVLATLITIVTPFILVLILLLIIQLHMLNKRVFKPLQTISSYMRKFTPGWSTERKSIGTYEKNEIGEIADSFEKMATDIDTYLHDIERMTAERLQFDVELEVARRIQFGMVPERTNLSGRTFRICGLAKPAREVGGDFYDCFMLGDGTAAAVIGDVSGKGVAAALFMAMTKAIIHDGLATGVGPANVLNHVNQTLCSSNPEGMFVTVFAVVFNPVTGEVRMANAGHGAPFVVGQSIREVKINPGILLGLFDDANLEEVVIELQPDENLLLVTDGVTEAISSNERFFGADGLMESLNNYVPFNTAEELGEAAIESVNTFANGREQFDDMTVLVLQRCSSQQDMRLVSNESTLQQQGALPADNASFEIIRDKVMAKSSDRAFGLRVCLACEEAFSNIVSYSGAQNIWVTVNTTEDGLCVILEDDGVPFNPIAFDYKKKPFEVLDEGGMGIGIIRDTTQKISYHYSTGRNILKMLF